MNLLREDSVPPPSEKKQSKKQDKKKQDKKKEDKKQKKSGEIKIASGAVGRGAFKKFVREAGARAEEEPEELMKDLGVGSAPDGTDIEKIMQILMVATNFNEAMKEAYLGAKKESQELHSGKVVDGVAVNTTAKINDRNAMKFILHTLKAAQNAGLLSLSGSVEIGVGKNAPIFVYSL